jgi:hypothetical protein
MLVALQDAPADQSGWEAFAFNNRASHDAISRALASRQSNPVTVPDLVLFPIEQTDFKGWLQRHALTHQQMDAALGSLSSDFSVLDVNDPAAVKRWIASHYLEHYTAETILGVAS